MVKKSLPLILVCALLLAACASSPAATPPVTAQAVLPSATVTSPPLPTPTTPPTSAMTETPEGTSVPAGCTVVSRASEPDPTVTSLFPAVSASDWIEGPDTARVTFIEYSDFQ